MKNLAKKVKDRETRPSLVLLSPLELANPTPVNSEHSLPKVILDSTGPKIQTFKDGSFLLSGQVVLGGEKTTHLAFYDSITEERISMYLGPEGESYISKISGGKR